MPLSKVETFEHDVAAEVLKKEASISQSASEENLIKEVTKEVTMPEEKSNSSVLLLVGVFVFIILGVGGYFGYTMVNSSPDTSTPVTTTTPTPTKKEVTFGTTFPDLALPLGPYVTSYKKNEYGYSVAVSDYSSAFSYIVKNEDTFIFSVAKVLPIVVNETPTTTIIYSDTTIANQNMRVATWGSSTVAYAFLNTSTLIISTSTDGLLRISSGIIK